VTNPRHDFRSGTGGAGASPTAFGPAALGGSTGSLLEAAPAACLLLDCEGVIRGSNEAGGCLLGGQPECLVGRTLSDFVSAGSRDTLIEHLVSVQSGRQPRHCDVELRLGAARSQRWLRLCSGLEPPDGSLAQNVICLAIKIDDLLARGEEPEEEGSAAVQEQWDPAYGAIPGEGEVPRTVSGRGVSEGEHLRVLVVDDDELFLNSTVRVLRGIGYSPTRCCGPREALDAFRADPDAYLAVVTDYGMPGMTGLELSAELRALRPGIPIMLVSGGATQIDQAALDEAGIWQILSKPINVEKLVGSLEELIREHGAEPPVS